MITTTETWVAPFGSVTLPVGHRENETRISLTVSEIFDRKQEPWTRYFFILIKPYVVDGLYDFARANLTSKSKILKFLMMATTISQKRWQLQRRGLHRLVAWLFRLATVETKLEYLLPFRRYSTRSKSPGRDVSLFLFLLLLSRSRTSFGTTCTWLQRSYRSAFKIHDFDDYNISGTITTTKTSFVPFGSVTLAPNYSENETRISHTVSEIFDRKHIALNAKFLYSYYSFSYSYSYSYYSFFPTYS